MSLTALIYPNQASCATETEDTLMCGRYQSYVDDDELKAIVDEAKEMLKKHILSSAEIFPTNSAPIITGSVGRSKAELCKWGFPNFRSKGVIINAKSETAEDKPMFSPRFLKSRCVVPSSGFYEWSQDKTKYHFSLPGEKSLYMAGLCGVFDGEMRYVILTASANESVEDVHDRMPLVLTRESIRPWLFDTDAARYMLRGDLPLLERREA